MDMGNGKVYFIGAGPGDPELITVKGKRIIEQADVIVYAGSLVNPKVIEERKPGACVHNSALMTLEEIISIMEEAVKKGLMVARVHTGDPSIFGAIREQIEYLRKREIPFEIVPGVSSFLGAAASLSVEYTVPGISQTVILTRKEGRTPVPPGQGLEELASHRASMVIFLSTAMIQDVVEELKKAYDESTPVAVVYRATWPDELVIRGTLADIAGEVAEAGIERTALILVGNFLGEDYGRSELYHPNFTHGFRQAQETPERVEGDGN